MVYFIIAILRDPSYFVLASTEHTLLPSFVRLSVAPPRGPSNV
jgi:hypothetical protein